MRISDWSSDVCSSDLGLIYRSAPGIAPSAVHLSAGLETDSMDVTGALSADAITEADLAVGRYDGAQVELFMTDWEMPEAGKLPLMRGQLGTVSHEDTDFSAELRGPRSEEHRTELQ